MHCFLFAWTLRLLCYSCCLHGHSQEVQSLQGFEQFGISPILCLLVVQSLVDCVICE